MSQGVEYTNQHHNVQNGITSAAAAVPGPSGSHSSHHLTWVYSTLPECTSPHL